MGYQSGYFSGKRLHSLYYQAWCSNQAPQAAIVIVHGLGCHSGTFTTAVHYFIHQGYAVYALDLRGHGRSAGQRGYIDAWSDFREDFQAFVQLVTDQQRDIPIFAWGHSLGSLVVLDYVLRCSHPLQGILISGLPMGKVGVSRVKLAIARLLSRIWPRFSLNTGIDPAINTRSLAALWQHAHDPLRHTRGTARLTTEVFRIQAELQRHVADFDIPVLIFHGGSDQTAPAIGGQAFFQALGCADKKWREYEGMYHDLHTDLNNTMVLTDMHHWLKQRLQPCPVTATTCNPVKSKAP